MSENMPLVNTNEELDLPISNIPEAALAKLTEKGYLPYVKLCGTSSAETEKGEIKPGTYVLCKDNSNKVVLTGEFDALVIAARPLACRKTAVTTQRFYDMTSDDYKDVEAESQSGGLSGSWHGTEFLIWVRGQRTWATYHASNPTARSRSAELTTILKNWAQARRDKKEALAANPAAVIVVPNPQVTFKCATAYYQKVRKSQWAPIFVPCTTPFSEVPPFAEIRDVSLKFQNPPKSEQETVESATGTTERG